MNPATISILKDRIFGVELTLEERDQTTTMDRVIYFENKLTLDDIKKCLANEDEAHLPEAIKTLLAARWERIKNTALCYTEAPSNETNCLCLELAKSISPLPETQEELDELQIGQGPYFQLMPTLAVAQDISGANIHEYKLHQFILSDDNSVFIPLQKCLDYGKDRQEGLLHVASTDITNYVALSANEIKRISNHSNAVRDYLKAVLNLQTAKKESSNLGARLRRLIHALRQGGAKKQGEELNSGAAANEGIVDFSTYWDTLSSSMHSELYRKYEGLEPLFGRLMRPESANYKETNYCVELIANALETICDNQRIGSIDIIEFERECTLKKERLERLSGNNHRYPLLPQNPNFNTFLPLIFQLPPNEQQRILNLPEDSNAWVYALEHAPEVLVNFASLLRNNDKVRAASLMFSNGMTPLHVAAEEGCESAMRLLRECGLSMNALDQWGNTPLMKTAMHGKIEVLTFLLSQDASIDEENEDGDTALTLAVEAGHREIIEALLAHNANITIRSEDGRNALELAIGSHPELLGTLLLKASQLTAEQQKELLKNIPGNFESVVSYTAARHPIHFTPILRELIQQGDRQWLNATHTMNINGASSKKISTLGLAVQYGTIDDVRALLEAGATVDPENGLCLTPLMIAAGEGKAHIVTLLLEKNASIDDIHNVNDTALHCAIRNRHFDIVNALLAKNASITVRKQNCNNAIDLVIRYGSREDTPQQRALRLSLTETLLQKALQLTLEEQKECLKGFTGNYENIISYAIVNHPSLIMPLLRSALQQRNGQILNSYFVADVVLRRGYRGQRIQSGKISTLGLAILYGNTDDVRTLLEAGVPVDSTERSAHTALMLAVEEEKIEVIALLLEKNASITFRNTSGNNAFDMARKINDHKIAGMILLKAAQLDLAQQEELTNKQSEIPKNALSYAAQNYKHLVRPMLKDIIQQNNTALINATHSIYYMDKTIEVSTLGLAVLYGTVDDVRALLLVGATVDPVTSTITSALILAIMSNKKEIVTLLLEKNASSNGMDPKKNTVLEIALARPALDIVETLLTKNALITSGCLEIAQAYDRRDFELLLVKASSLGLDEQKELLKNLKPGPHETVLSYTAEANTPLFKSILKNAIETKNRAILDATFTVYLGPNKKPYKTSTLALVARVGDSALIQALLDAGVGINPTEPGHLSALMMAAMEGRSEIVKYLLNKNASIDLLNTDNNTALNLAIIRKHVAVIETLLSNNASIASRNMDNENALDLLVVMVREYMPKFIWHILVKVVTLSLEAQKEMLKNVSQRGYENAFSYAANEYPEHLNSLIREAIKTNNTALLNASHAIPYNLNNLTVSTLSLAVIFGVEETVREVLALGVATADGHQALKFAQAMGKDNIILRLLDSGARVDLCAQRNDKIGNNTIQWYIANAYNESMVSALRRKGFPCHRTIKDHEIAKATLQFLPSEKKIILNITDNALHLKSKEELNALIASIPSEITHVSINGDDPVEKAKVSDTPLMILCKINFNEHFKQFKDIERSMRLNAESAQKIILKNNKQKPTYKAAADAAQMLCQALECARDTFLRTHNKVEFIANCETAAQGAQELTRHRGCRLAIAEFMRALLSLISTKAVTYLTNKYHLFTPKTTSHKKLDGFTRGVTVEKNRIPC